MNADVHILTKGSDILPYLFLNIFLNMSKTPKDSKNP